jgi:hypothetical protein
MGVVKDLLQCETAISAEIDWNCNNSDTRGCLDPDAGTGFKIVADATNSKPSRTRSVFKMSVTP